MAGDLGVQVVYTGVRRQWRETEGGDVWLRLRAADVDPVVVDGAVEAANAPTLSGSAEVLGSFVSPTPDGWSFGVVDAESLDALRSWIDTLARELGRAGVSGVLDAVPSVRLPVYATSSAEPPEPAAFVFCSVDLPAMTGDPDRDMHWFVPPGATDRIAGAAVDFAEPVAGSTVLTQGVYLMKADPAVVPEALGRAVRRARTSGVDVLPDRGTCRHVAWCVPGHVVHQLIGASEWTTKVDSLRRALTAVPEAVDLGFVRPARRGVLSVQGLHQAQSLPGIHESDVRYNVHLLDRFVPDAHGMQVLRDAHLERANNLGAWTITSLGHGRHLVEARDLEPWYADPLPDPDVLAAARADFEPMLLTEQVIGANRPPWWSPPRYT